MNYLGEKQERKKWRKCEIKGFFGKLKEGWNFFFDTQENYGGLKGVLSARILVAVTTSRRKILVVSNCIIGCFLTTEYCFLGGGATSPLDSVYP